MTRAGKTEAARTEQMAYCFSVVFTLQWQESQVLVGEHIWLPQHVFLKTPWPDCESHHLKLWVPATALPVLQDSAVVWWPANSLTAEGCLLFLHNLVWTKFTVSGQMGALNTAGKWHFCQMIDPCCLSQAIIFHKYLSVPVMWSSSLSSKAWTGL